MPQEPDITSAIAEEALQRTPRERTVYLEGVCAARPELRKAVEELIRATAPTSQADQMPTAHLQADQDSRPATGTLGLAEFVIDEGTVIGPYKLLQELGAGGMGVVYMAEQQEPVRRKVALKIIKPGMDTREVLARFEAERQALAMMDHPNIARVLDAAATPSGRPYFVMELVKGVPITEYCDKERLSTRERLDLFIPVCRAVQHAHHKGIIHRDLKPLNILVTLHDNQPVPKVIDFGVAKAIGSRLTDKTVFTRISQPVGTPTYMSPEQAEMSGLDVDTRSDVYSLGVLLYELITGTTPFEPGRLQSAGFGEMQRIIREESPPKPSTRLSTLGDALINVAELRRAQPARLGSLIEGELDWVVMKAMEKDRTRRYETADAFARDIQNFLDGELVTARPPSTAYRLAKFARRHKTWLATAAAIFVALVVGTAVSTWQAIRASRAEARALELLDKVAMERNAAREARDQAEAVSEFVLETMKSPDPERDGRQVTVAERLDAAVGEVDEGFEDEPKTKARLLTVLGKTYSALGLPEDAVPLYLDAQAIWRVEGISDAPDALIGASALAGAHYAAGRIDQAKNLYRQTLDKMKIKLGPADPSTLVTARALADILLAAGQITDAIGLYESVLDEQRKSLPPNDLEVLSTEVNLAYALKMAGQASVAVEALEAALENLRQTQRPHHPRTLATMNLLAGAYLDANRSTEAIDLFRETWDLRKEALGPNHSHTLGTAGNLAQAYRHAGKTEDAIELYLEIMRRLGESFPGNHPQMLVIMNSLAVAYEQAGRRPEGIQLLEDALRGMRNVLDADHRELLIAKKNLAHLYWIDGNLERALPLQQEMFDGYRRSDPQGSRTIYAAVRLLEIYVASGSINDAITLAESFAGPIGALPSQDLALSTFQTAYATALLQRQKFDKARDLLEDAVQSLRQAHPVDWQTARAECLLGASLVGLREFEAAEKLLTAGLERLQGSERDIPPPCRQCIPDAALALIQLYEARAENGDDERAAPYRKLIQKSSTN